MKKLKNKKTEIKYSETESYDYKGLCELCLNVIPQGGLDTSMITARLDVKSALEKAKSEITFTTKAQIDTLKECVTSFRWAVILEDAVNFVEDVKKL